MKPIEVIGNQPGGVLRIVAGGALIGWDLQRWDGRAALSLPWGLFP